VDIKKKVKRHVTDQYPVRTSETDDFDGNGSNAAGARNGARFDVRAASTSGRRQSGRAIAKGLSGSCANARYLAFPFCVYSKRVNFWGKDTFKRRCRASSAVSSSMIT